MNGLAAGCIVTADSFTRRSSEDAEQRDAPRRKLAVFWRRGDSCAIANVAAYLASDECGFITGQVLLAVGGHTDYISPIVSIARDPLGRAGRIS